MKTIFLAEVVALMSLVLLTQQARAGEDYPPRYSSSATRIKIGSGVRVMLYTGKPESQEQLVTTPVVGLKMISPPSPKNTATLPRNFCQ
jgi:hypothetical protein